MSETEDTANTELRTKVLLYVQRALVGEITPEMRFITVEFSAAFIRITVFVDGPIIEEHRDEFDAGAIAELFADFAWPERGDPQVSFQFVRCDQPEKPDFRGVLVYGRLERYRD